MKRRAAGVLVSLSLLAGSANAGTSTGPIAMIMAHVGDIVIFDAGSHQGKPACHTVGEQWALSLATPTGRAMYALLLSAQIQGKSVSVTGSGTCSAWGDRESPLFIIINL